MRYYDHYVIFDTIQATGADLDMDRGWMTINGLDFKIPVNGVRGATQDAYDAGTASDKTWDLNTGVTYAADDTFYVEITQAITGYKRRFFYYPSGTPTAALFVDALVAAINNDDPNCPVTATDAGNSIQLVLDNVQVDGLEEGDFDMQVYQNGNNLSISPTVNTAYDSPQGIPAMVRAEVGDSTAGSDSGQYTRYVFTYNEAVIGSDPADAHLIEKTVAVYVNETAANFAGFDLDDYLLGTKSGKTYNGAKRYVLNGVPQ